MPTVKHHITGQRSNIVKKCLASHQGLAKHDVFLIAPLHHRMEQERQQIEAQHRCRQISFTMAEVMLQVIALGLEHIVVLVLTLPPPATGLCHLCHVVRTDTVVGDKRVVIELFTRFGVSDGDFNPVDRERLLAIL